MILRVYADESYDKAEVLCGFMDTPDYWEKFSRRWKMVLKDFNAPYFHFREFVDQKNRYKIPNNPFLNWTEKMRDRFLNELAIVLSESAVPIGSILDLATVRTTAVVTESEAMEMLIAQFYVNFSQQLNSHWPGFQGNALFVFDKTTNSDWISTLTKIHNKAQIVETRIGGLTFESDTSCLPLQAADFQAYLSRQNTEKYFARGKTKQVKRTLDWILSKNYYPKFKNQYTTAQWEKLVRLILADRKEKKATWAKQGDPNKVYIPELHFDYQKHGLNIIDQSE